MSSRYQIQLDVIRSRLGNNAQTDVELLYKILTKEDKKKPQEARQILEHDLGDLYAKRTILQFLPDECKDEEKQKAGKTEKKQKIIIDTSGKPTEPPAAASAAPPNSQNDTVNKVKEVYPGLEEDQNYTPPEDPQELRSLCEKQLQGLKDRDACIQEQNEEINQLKAALKQQSFKPASDVESEKYELVVDGINTEHFPPMDISHILSKVVSPLRNRNWKVVELWARFVK